jgi:Bacterial SH3 domain.
MTGVVPAMTQTATPSMTAAPVMEGDCLIVRASAGDDGALNLRKGPGVGYAVMVVMPDGQTLRKMSSASAGDWIKVRVDMDGRWWIGYVRSLYVRPCD